MKNKTGINFANLSLFPRELNKNDASKTIDLERKRNYQLWWLFIQIMDWIKCYLALAFSLIWKK